MRRFSFCLLGYCALRPHESKAQVSLTRAGDGSAELAVGDSTFVNLEPGQLATVANSDGRLRLSFSKDGKPDNFFGNVMAADTGTGVISILDKQGRLSNLEPGSRINVTSAGWDHIGEMRPIASERTATGFGLDLRGAWWQTRYVHEGRQGASEETACLRFNAGSSMVVTNSSMTAVAVAPSTGQPGGARFPSARSRE